MVYTAINYYYYYFFFQQTLSTLPVIHINRHNNTNIRDTRNKQEQHQCINPVIITLSWSTNTLKSCIIYYVFEMQKVIQQSSALMIIIIMIIMMIIIKVFFVQRCEMWAVDGHAERFAFWRLIRVLYQPLFPYDLFIYFFLPTSKAANQGVSEPSRSVKISTLRFYWFVLFLKESHLVWAWAWFLCTCACIFKVVAELCITVLRCIPP